MRITPRPRALAALICAGAALAPAAGGALPVAEGYEILALRGTVVLSLVREGAVHPDYVPVTGDPDMLGVGTEETPFCGPRQYDFGDGAGCVSTGDAALIVKRVRDVTEFEPTTRLQIKAMAVRSLNPVYVLDPDAFELSSLRILATADGTEILGGPVATCPDPDCILTHSTLTLEGSLTGSMSLVYTAPLIGLDTGAKRDVDFYGTTPVGWTHDLPETSPPIVAIEGVNLNLGGAGGAADMWRDGSLASGAWLSARIVPLPPALAMMAVALAALAGSAALRRR